MCSKKKNRGSLSVTSMNSPSLTLSHVIYIDATADVEALWSEGGGGSKGDYVWTMLEEKEKKGEK